MGRSPKGPIYSVLAFSGLHQKLGRTLSGASAENRVVFGEESSKIEQTNGRSHAIICNGTD
jgi:hypothetical protein